MSMKDLTVKQKRFVKEYLVDLSQTRAARRAGYSEENARNSAYTVMKSPKVQKAIKEEQKRLAEKFGITPERIIQELTVIGLANIKDYLVTDEDGNTTIDLGAIDRDSASALEVQFEINEGRTKTKNTKIKLANKLEALINLGKHLGMFKEQVEHTGTLTLEQLVEHSMKNKPVEYKDTSKIETIEYQEIANNSIIAV